MNVQFSSAHMCACRHMRLFGPSCISPVLDLAAGGAAARGMPSLPAACSPHANKQSSWGTHGGSLRHAKVKVFRGQCEGWKILAAPRCSVVVS